MDWVVSDTLNAEATSSFDKVDNFIGIEPLGFATETFV